LALALRLLLQRWMTRAAGGCMGIGLLAAPVLAASVITTVTFNVHEALSTGTSSAFHATGRILRHLNADVYALQELPAAANAIQYARLLRDQYLTNYYMVRSGNHDNANRQAIFSRYPLVDFDDVVTNTWVTTGNYLDDYTNKFTRELLWARVRLPAADPLDVFSAHLKATGSSGTDPFYDPLRRDNEARMIRACLAQRATNAPAEQVLLCGDMNTDWETPAQGQAVAILSDGAAQVRLTTTPVNPVNGLKKTYYWGTNRFDYQFPNPRLTNTLQFVFRTDVGTPPAGLHWLDSIQASDHYPVVYRYALTAPVPLARTRILISEVNVWRSSDKSNEFVELYNAGDVTQDLQGWSMGSPGSRRLIATAPALLQPGDYALIQIGEPAWSEATSAGDHLLRLYLAASELPFTGTAYQLALGNARGHFVDAILWNNNGTQTTLADEFNELSEYMWRYAMITNAAGYNARTVHTPGTQTANGRALYRYFDPPAGDYLESDQTNDWRVEENTPGTPGSINPAFPEPGGGLPLACVLMAAFAAWQRLQ